LLRHSQNQGVSAAIMTGLQEAREIACSIDCDCSYDPTLLKPMLMKMIEGVDLVTASPYHPDGAVLNVPKWRLLLSRCSSLLYRVVTGQKLYTFTACMRVYRRSTVLTLAVESPGFLGVAELLSRLVLNGKKVVEHPATLEVRIFGQSKMKVLRTISGHLKLLSHLTVLRWKGEKRVTSSDSAVNSQASTSAAVVTEVEL
jgi:glycosyltransferase involved in cell wall biosynthesis